MALVNNTLTHKAIPYERTQIKNPTKKGIQIISEMETRSILGHLAHKHRVGLLMTTVFSLVFYIAWDKVLHIFF